MPVIIDGSAGITTPGETNTGNLSVAGSTTLTTPLPVASGGTGASSLSGITTGTATNIAGGSNGTIPYQSASGTTQMLAVGTSGQVLQTNGAGAPTWATPSTGALVLLSTVTASASATVDVETTFNSTYDVYKIFADGVFAATDNVEVYCRFKLGGAYATSGYKYNYSGWNQASNAWVGNGTQSATENTLVGQTGNSQPMTLEITIYNPSSTTIQKNVIWTGAFTRNTATPNYQSFQGTATNTAVTAFTGFRFYFSSGNVTSGTFRLYGIAKT